jgi:hypothetical protein
MDPVGAIVTLGAVKSSTPTSRPRVLRHCAVCGLAVGVYEPAVFSFRGDVVHSSLAAEPGMAGEPGCRLTHGGCFAESAGRAQLRLVADGRLSAQLPLVAD